ncbi:MAG: ankyrin repeat domain-containing protein [Candidatus Eremiobacteraeota bacterium]|nr:ankyrin repeat domain-containing protein [Candidatus Eremiobacteraeota bacterium]
MTALSFSKACVLIVFVLLVLHFPAAASDLDSLVDAVNAGNAEKVRLILRKSPGIVNLFVINGNRPLHYAVQQNRLEIVKILVQNGADVNAKNHIGVTPWETAAAQGFGGIAEYLAGKGARTYNRELQAAVFENKLEKTEELLKLHPGQVNQGDGEGTRLLQVAACNGYDEMVRLLIARGADVNAHNDSGTTALQEAVYKKNRPMIDLLLSERADPDGKDCRGYTSLHLAVELGDYDVASRILSAGAKINVRGMGGLTPLHLAAMQGRLRIMELLLSKGAAVNARTEEGKTPLKLALEHKRTEAAKLLKSKGGTR